MRGLAGAGGGDGFHGPNSHQQHHQKHEGRHNDHHHHQQQQQQRPHSQSSGASPGAAVVQSLNSYFHKHNDRPPPHQHHHHHHHHHSPATENNSRFTSLHRRPRSSSASASDDGDALKGSQGSQWTAVKLQPEELTGLEGQAHGWNPAHKQILSDEAHQTMWIANCAPEVANLIDGMLTDYINKMQAMTQSLAASINVKDPISSSSSSSSPSPSKSTTPLPTVSSSPCPAVATAASIDPKALAQGHMNVEGTLSRASILIHDWYDEDQSDARGFAYGLFDSCIRILGFDVWMCVTYCGDW
eukprot:CAMPEP_0197844632 /NCGR_PEP_ID=MMETSP1438-20131217/1632_1 /TAXON_ID=1461541 /ORGANISM="Pterosperma sp., Strain CCMP1384" /LENGTH=299 /DNA_ID=CAMNT_0043455547 /DNA_START=13 /DNA_END=912 /DNA_ORIENTATION=-